MHLLLVEGAFSLCHPCLEVSMTDARISVQLSECVAPELALIANISLARIVTSVIIFFGLLIIQYLEILYALGFASISFHSL